ncbi:hypothetical protein Bca52824_011573 [Brassica carinata]|uniref:peptidylprolyl isomerase n=1 Tax=Brassica carinata TaxID=52824 RepID=A0A8X7VX15_BRACI|nr:hypothetical protein Bca52824_011573 [Brassica carinata]
MILPMKLLHPLFSFTTLPSSTHSVSFYTPLQTRQSKPYRCSRVIRSEIVVSPAPVSYEGRRILLTDSAEAVSTSRRARLVIVPPELAYGKKGVQEIPPNATVELDIELLSIKQSPFGTPVKIVEG